jgi:stage V sporulation protein B
VSSKNKEKKVIKKSQGAGNSFAFQAAVLAGAGLLSRVIGLLYRSPLYHIIGDEGNGYYGTAYVIYSMILLISTYSIPMAVSKVISGKLALGEYKNAKKMFKCAFLYVIVVGGAAALLTYIFAPVLVKEQPNSIICLRILAPTIFLSGILSVFRGYMQAYNTMVPTSISQILEQLANAVISVMAAYMLSAPFTKGTTEYAKYGAAGSAMGTGAGVMAGLIFILLAFSGKRKEINDSLKLDTNKHEESYGVLFKQIFCMITPVVLATFVYNISSTIDMKIFYGILDYKKVDELTSANMYGIFSGQYVVLINLPVAIASAVSTAMVPGVSASYTKGDVEYTNSRLNEALRLTMMVTIPCAVGMAVLAEPIISLLFKGASPIASHILTAGSISVVFYSLSTVTNGVLQGIGKVMEPVKNSGMSLIIHIVVLFLILWFTDINLYGLIIGTVIYAFLTCLFNARSVNKYLHTRMDIKHIFVAPAISSIFMGAVAFVVYQAIYRFIIHSNVVALFASIFVAALFYLVAIIKVGGYGREELGALPKGHLIIKLAVKLHLIK